MSISSTAGATVSCFATTIRKSWSQQQRGRHETRAIGQAWTVLVRAYGSLRARVAMDGPVAARGGPQRDTQGGPESYERRLARLGGIEGVSSH